MQARLSLHKIYALCSIVLIAVYSAATMAVNPIYTGGKERAAIKGYDTVAYFTQNEAIKGNAQFSTDYLDATWHFSNQQNLDLFLSNPEKYLPQYGGYCAYAISRNTTASVKPKYFTVHDGKLYLNYNKGVQKKWLSKKSKHIDLANTNWPSLLKK